jgi:hypothetical protein
MKRIASKAALRLSILALAGAFFPAAAQDLQNSQIEIAYVEPAKAEYQPIYQGLKKRQVLEELRAFLAPLELPKKITIKTEQCNQPDKLYQPGGPVAICYEYVARLAQLADNIPTDSRAQRGVSRDDAVVGAFVQVVLQKMSSAVFDVLGTPVWGREQDAADKLAAFLMLQFGKETARKLLNGAAYFFEASDRTWTGSDFSDVRSPEAQRFYNYLCVAYGYDKKTFEDFVEHQGGKPGAGTGRSDILPLARAVQCQKEYTDLKWAFDTTIMSTVNQDLLEKVLVRDWLQPGDGK